MRRIEISRDRKSSVFEPFQNIFLTGSFFKVESFKSCKDRFVGNCGILLEYTCQKLMDFLTYSGLSETGNRQAFSLVDE